MYIVHVCMPVNCVSLLDSHLLMLCLSSCLAVCFILYHVFSVTLFLFSVVSASGSGIAHINIVGLCRAGLGTEMGD